jgi:EAL domain-containing protein (putative c-di-GMP-specific phosphodiesterase class I)
VQSIATDPGDATLVSTMISMAKGLKKRVVGEGVEIEEQMAFLQALGCDEAQGYYFSKPVAAAQFAKLLEKRPAPFFIPYFPTLPFPIDKPAHISRTAKAH